MTLENKIKSFAGKASSLVLAGAIGMSSMLATGCSKRHANKVLGSPVNAITEQTSGYSFCGDSIEASIIPAYRPVNEVTVKTTLPDGTFSTEYLTDSDGDGKYTKKISPTTQYGNYNFEFEATSGQQDETVQATVPVCMNEAQSDSALEQAIKQISPNALQLAVGSYYSDAHDPTQIADDEIMSYWGPNCVGATGYNPDIVDVTLEIKKSDPLGGPPAYGRFYAIDVQGSKTDTLDNAKKDYMHSVWAGHLFLEPVKSVNDIVSKLQSEKSNKWQQLRSDGAGAPRVRNSVACSSQFIRNR